MVGRSFGADRLARLADPDDSMILCPYDVFALFIRLVPEVGIVTSKGDNSRQRILDTVTELFLQNGFHGTGIQEISEAAGMGRGALYYHIGSKEQILFEISMSLLEAAKDATLPFATRDDPPNVKFRNVARALLRHHATHGEGWLVAIQEARFLSDEHRAMVLEERQRFEDIWREILSEGAAAKYWRPVDAIDVRGILGMFNYAARWLRLDGRLSPEQIADRYVDMLLDGIVAPTGNGRSTQTAMPTPGDD